MSRSGPPDVAARHLSNTFNGGCKPRRDRRLVEYDALLVVDAHQSRWLVSDAVVVERDLVEHDERAGEVLEASLVDLDNALCRRAMRRAMRRRTNGCGMSNCTANA